MNQDQIRGYSSLNFRRPSINLHKENVKPRPSISTSLSNKSSYSSLTSQRHHRIPSSPPPPVPPLPTTMCLVSVAGDRNQDQEPHHDVHTQQQQQQQPGIVTCLDLDDVSQDHNIRQQQNLNPQPDPIVKPNRTPIQPCTGRRIPRRITSFDSQRAQPPRSFASRSNLSRVRSPDFGVRSTGTSTTELPSISNSSIGEGATGGNRRGRGLCTRVFVPGKRMSMSNMSMNTNTNMNTHMNKNMSRSKSCNSKKMKSFFTRVLIGLRPRVHFRRKSASCKSPAICRRTKSVDADNNSDNTITVSSPLDPVHVTHIGYDEQTGQFVGLPKEWQKLLTGKGDDDDDDDDDDVSGGGHSTTAAGGFNIRGKENDHVQRPHTSHY